MIRRWGRGGGIALLVGSLACVPPAEEEAPKGAIGIVTVPSAATRGEPFVTSDGWTVTIERFAMQGGFTVVQGTDESGGYFGTEHGLTRFAGDRPVDVLVRAIPVGPAVATIHPQDGFDVESLVSYARPDNLGVDDATLARFDRASDDPRTEDDGITDEEGTYYPPLPVNGPAFIIALHAEKAGRTIRLDLALSALVVMQPNVATVVRANARTEARVGIYAEGFLGPKREFGLIADADADANGIVTAAELDAVKVKCEDGTFPDWPKDEERPSCSTALQHLEGNLELVGPPPG